MGDFGLILFQINTVQNNCKNVFVKEFLFRRIIMFYFYKAD
jgi:hypothetical protein